MARLALIFAFILGSSFVGSTASLAQVGRAVGRSNPQIRADADPQDNTERFVVLAPAGAVVVELHVNVDGRPFRQMREELVDELLAAADADGDGKPTWREAAASQRFGFGVVYNDAQRRQREAALQRLDRNRNEVVDREEVRLYLAQLGGPAFSLTAFNYNRSPELKSLIDTDGDATLSTSELKAATGRLAMRDANDDEALDAAELSGGGPYGVRMLAQNRGGGRRVTPPPGAFLLGPSADLVALHEAMKKKYRLGGRLDASALGLDDARFAKLDLDDSGELEAGEAIGWHVTSPHLVLAIDLQTAADAAPRLKVAACDTQRGEQLTSTSATAVELAGLGAVLGIDAAQATAAPNYEATAASLVKRYDADNNGYLEEKEFDGQNNAQYLAAQFAAWDADGDGKVFPTEIEADYARRQAPAMSRVSAMVNDRGVSLFASLDADGDGRLGLRERNQAGDRLRTYDKNDDGKVTPDEMPTRIEVRIGAGRVSYSASYGRGGQAAGAENSAASSDGLPGWFTHMDTNADGDVSRREFLGPAEAFQKLDADGDGLLDAGEAAKADDRQKAKSRK